MLFFNLSYFPTWCTKFLFIYIQGAAERTPLFGKLINSKPKKIRQMHFYFWKVHRMPFYINSFWTKHHSSGGLEYWYTDVASLGSCPWPWESFQVQWQQLPVVSPPSELPKFGDVVRKPLLWGSPREKNRRGSNLANAAATRYYRRPAIFYKLLDNKGSMFSRPCNGVHWKRHVHRCSTTRSPPLHAPHPKLCPSQIGEFFLPHPV